MGSAAWWYGVVAGAVVLASACTTAGSPELAVASESAATEADPAPDPSPTPATSATPTGSPTSAPEARVAAAAPSPLPANAAVLDFRARRLAGGTFDGAQLAGGDVALWMWAPWCPQCNREAPHVAEALETFGDEVTIVGIAGHDTDDAHRAFVAEHGLEQMLQLVDDDGSLWAQYDVSYQPAWVLIDEDGHVERVAGGLYDDLDARLQALVDR